MKHFIIVMIVFLPAISFGNNKSGLENYINLLSENLNPEEMHDFKVAFDHYFANEYELARALIKKWDTGKNDHYIIWVYLQGLLDFKRKDFYNAKKAMDSIIDKTREFYYTVNTQGTSPNQFSEDQKNVITWVYLNVLYIRGGSKYFTKQNGVLTDLIEFENVRKGKRVNDYVEEYDGVVYFAAAVCYLRENEYLKSKAYFEKSFFSTVNDDVFKSGAAYNVAALYARNGDVKNAMIWLGKAFMLNKEKNLKAIETDHDFDCIRSNTDFIDLLREYKTK